ncbi:MAG: DUF2510 domain-containing protein [Ferrimicrobium sp.]|uniref:DUF2510 domain-containing protein n=1 Tax=Ferrimicrobium sp. TaxID=2926050 RepID=UPI00262563A0|nr:DUF2510 domain-containing protein [Ferrimicrobium sp.]
MLGSRREIRPPMRPGWYPQGEGRLRYFDGQAWTTSVRQRPSFTNFVRELPTPEVAFLQPVHRHRRLVRVVSLLIVVLLFGGIIAQLIVFSMGGSSSPKIQSLASYRHAADHVCESVFDGVSVVGLEKNAGALLNTKLSQGASAFSVLASETRNVPLANTVAARWSDLAIAWSKYLRGHKSHRTSVLRSMRAVDQSANAVGVKGCAVFTPSAQRAVLS